MQNTHETHNRETQNLQAKIHQLEQIVESSKIQQLQQVQSDLIVKYSNNIDADGGSSGDNML